MLRSYHPLLLHGFKAQQEDLIHVRCGYITFFFFSLFFSHSRIYKHQSRCCYQGKIMLLLPGKKIMMCYQGKIMSSIAVNEFYKTIQEQVD